MAWTLGHVLPARRVREGAHAKFPRSCAAWAEAFDDAEQLQHARPADQGDLRVAVATGAIVDQRSDGVWIVDWIGEAIRCTLRGTAISVPPTV